MKKIETRIIECNSSKKIYFVPQYKRFFMWHAFKEWKINLPFPARYVEVTFDNLEAAQVFVGREVAAIRKKHSERNSIFKGPKIVDQRTFEV